MLVLALPAPGRMQAQSPNYLHAEGNQIVDSNGNRVLVTGISWFGMETENFAPHGLWARSLDSFLDQIVELGFNTIRLPYSNQLFDPASVPNGINYDLNPDLAGLSGLEIMDQVITGAGERGLKVILDRHRPDSHAQSELWYTPQVSEERWIGDWVMLAERYAGNDTVIGADLHNEPRGQATWGSDDPATDWRLAAERAGNAILEVNPNWLIIVQGVEQYGGEYYWWGGNLMGVRDHPVRLSRPEQLVYSPHTYGPGVYPQKWFSDPSFPANMPGIWDQHWGFVHKEGIAPLILGEFGGRSVENDQEGVWQRALVDYLRQNQISYLYWTLNPNSGDTGGILLDDWQSIDPKKKELLSGFQAPLIGSGQSLPDAPTAAVPGTSPTEVAPQPATGEPGSATEVAPTTTAAPANPTNPPPATTANTAVALASGLEVRYHTVNPAERVNDAKPEFIIANHSAQAVRLEDLELIYWFSDDPGQTYAFTCDWAQIGCEKISAEFEAREDGLYALRIRFRPGSGELPPGGETGEMKLRFNRNDWSEFSQTDDYSFSGAGGFVAWQQVSLYQAGQQVWGSEPEAVGAEPTAGAMPSPAANESPTAAVSLAGTPQPAAPLVTQAGEPAEILPANRWWVWAMTIGAFAAGVLITALILLRRRQ